MFGKLRDVLREEVSLRSFFVLLAVVFFSFSFMESSLCVWKFVFGVPCPGCGFTRAAFCLLRGDFIGAFRRNLMVLPLLLWFSAAAACSFTGRRAWRFFYGATTSRYGVCAAVVLMLLSWAYNFHIGN